MNIRWQAALWSLGLAVFCYWAAPARADEWNKRTTLQFNQPVEVPGHVLSAGKYVFELADVTADRNVVQIFSEDKQGKDHLVTTEMAIPDYRLDTPEKSMVTFEERRSDTPEAVHAWWYPGDNYGWEFVYPKAEQLQIAANTTPARVHPAAPAAPAPKPAASTPSARTAAVPAAKPAPQRETAPEPVTVAQNKPPAQSQSQPAPATAPKTLPKTASNLPLAGALGIPMAGLGAMLLMARRRARV
ncbi:MAG TPA: LPXTG cell wall anchor domain-containing protein [Bryobacteraceae bacterium]|nr:LPXTG cell wall anchor domain-containing protein [Bryobacteraceae bacterium]